MAPPKQYHEAVKNARTFLFVPGQQPERFAKALASGADAVILDLEDAVPPTEKLSARRSIEREWSALTSQDIPIVIRLNALETTFGAEDRIWLHRFSPFPVVMVPKAEGAANLCSLRHEFPDLGLLPLVESAKGWATLEELSAVPGVLRLVLGHLDFIADTGLSVRDDQRELDPLRYAIAMHTRLNNLAPAVDGVTLRIDDEARLHADTERALGYGFGGKLCIHPRQVAFVHKAMTPKLEEIIWAQRILQGNTHSGGSAFKLDGCMVDLPVVQRARQTLQRAFGCSHQK